MASLRVLFSLFMLVHAILLLSNPVNCNEIEDKLLQGLNNFRSSLHLLNLKENDNAECLADEIAEKIEDQPCSSANSVDTDPGSYPDLVKKCKININTTGDGKILSACVPNLVSSLVLSNFTDSPYSKYFNDSKYTGVGIGSEDEWIVVVLSTNTAEGSFTGAAARVVSKVGLGNYLLSLFLGFFLLNLTTS